MALLVYVDDGDSVAENAGSTDEESRRDARRSHVSTITERTG